MPFAESVYEMELHRVARTDLNDVFLVSLEASLRSQWKQVGVCRRRGSSPALHFSVADVTCGGGGMGHGIQTGRFRDDALRN